MILIDTSGLLAAVDPRQAFHEGASRVLRKPEIRLLSPFVLAELDYLLATGSGLTEERKLLRDVARGVYRLETFSETDVGMCLDVIDQYADFQLGLADASIVVLARRHGVRDILTLDQRHFRVVPGPDGQAFRLFPADAA